MSDLWIDAQPRDSPQAVPKPSGRGRGTEPHYAVQFVPLVPTPLKGHTYFFWLYEMLEVGTSCSFGSTLQKRAVMHRAGIHTEEPSGTPKTITSNLRRLGDLPRHLHQRKLRKRNYEFTRRRQVFMFSSFELLDEVPG